MVESALAIRFGAEDTNPAGTWASSVCGRAVGGFSVVGLSSRDSPFKLGSGRASERIGTFPGKNARLIWT